MNKEIHFSDEARSGLYNGVTKLTDAVKVTMGPRGRNVLIQKPNGATHITKDGVSVAREIFLKDNLENMGAQAVKEVSANVAEEAGDGTTTATVLTHAIFKEGLRQVTAGSNPIELKRGMDKATIEIIESLKKSSKEVKDKEQITQVATISANSDSAIGKLIAEAMEKVGKDGIITVEEATGIEDELGVAEGMQFDRGYLSPYFVTNQDKMTCEMANPYILVTDLRVHSLKEILPILEQTQQTGRPLFIICDEIDGEALSTLILNKVKGVINVTVVKAPGFGERKKEYLSDIAVLTGANFISDNSDKTLGSVALMDLGESIKVVVDKDKTVIIDGQGNRTKVDDTIRTIKSKMEIETGYEKEKLQERLAKLTGGVAVIKIGAITETEMFEKKDRVDDALAATKAAVQEGIVIGGGCALIRASQHVNTLKLEGDELDGALIVIKALQAPLRQIAINAGYDDGVVLNKVQQGGTNFGFDASKDEYVDMFDAGIIDPLKVTRVALKNAVSIASMLLTTEATIGIIKEDFPIQMPEM